VRTKLAHLPVSKTLDSFDFDAQPNLDRRIIKELQTLAFIDRAENVALLGPSGVGKTHLAIGLGMKALQAGVRLLPHRSRPSRSNPRRATRRHPGHKQRHLNTVPLLLIDEIGYVAFDKPSATWFFQLMCQRYEHRATVITSNKPFVDWASSAMPLLPPQ
jgi:DNA replication protein DnaC